MKGNEIIHEMNKAKMPDAEQVRQACHATQSTTVWNTQSETRGWLGLRRMRLGVAAMVAVVTLVFAGSAAYAVGVAVGIIGAGQRLETGGSTTYVFVPRDDPEYLANWDSAIHGMPIYISVQVDSPWYANAAGGRFLPDDAHVINAMLDGMLFLADGNPFPYDLLVYDNPHGFEDDFWQRYTADTRGHALYDANGGYIGSIRVWEQRGELIDIEIQTLSNLMGYLGYHDTLEDALYALGTDFNLPTVHIDAFSAPVFNVWEGQQSVAVFFLYENSIGTAGHIRLHMEAARYDGSPIWERRFPGEAAHFIIAGTDVYQITGEQYATYFLWEHEGIIYRLFPPFSLADEGETLMYFTQGQLYELIASMIE